MIFKKRSKIFLIFSWEPPPPTSVELRSKNSKCSTHSGRLQIAYRPRRHHIVNWHAHRWHTHRRHSHTRSWWHSRHHTHRWHTRTRRHSRHARHSGRWGHLKQSLKFWTISQKTQDFIARIINVQKLYFRKLKLKMTADWVLEQTS